MYETALEQANVILKYLLGARSSLHLSSQVVYAYSCCEQVVGLGRVDVASLLLDTLPAELAAISTPEQRVAGYLVYRQLFIV